MLLYICTMFTISIKSIVLVHWMFLMWAVLVNWCGPAYIWCNASVIAMGIWAIADRQSVDALFMFIIMHLGSVLVDIVVLSVYFGGTAGLEEASASVKFSEAMCIINLILKPLSTILLYKMYRDRGGVYNINFGANAPSYDQIGGETAEGCHGSNAEFPNVMQPQPTNKPDSHI